MAESQEVALDLRRPTQRLQPTWPWLQRALGQLLAVVFTGATCMGATSAAQAEDLPAAVSATDHLARIADAVARNDMRGELSAAQAAVQSYPADAQIHAAWVAALLRAGDYGRAVAVLADDCAAHGARPADRDALVAALTQWRTADPSRPGQLSGWQRVLGGWPEPAAQDDPRQHCQRHAVQALRQAATAAPPSRPAETTPARRSPLQPTPATWWWVGVSAAVFIGGASWLTRKQR